MNSRVRLNVGGQIFETSFATLERAGRDTFLGALLDPFWRAQDLSSDDLDYFSSQGGQGALTPSNSSSAARQCRCTPARHAIYNSAGSRNCSSLPTSPLNRPGVPAGTATYLLLDGMALPPEALVSAAAAAAPSFTRTLSAVYESPQGKDQGTEQSQEPFVVSRSGSAPCMSHMEQAPAQRRGPVIEGPLAPCTAQAHPPSAGPSEPAITSLATPAAMPKVQSVLPVRTAPCTVRTEEPAAARKHHTADCIHLARCTAPTPAEHGTALNEHSVPPRLARSLFPEASLHGVPSLPQIPPPLPGGLCGSQEIFLDRDPAVFRCLLNLLRTGHLSIPRDVNLQSVLSDADYLGLLDVVKDALLPQQLDATEMEKVASLRPNVGPNEACTALCGNQDGSLTMAHGCRITAYDWMLERITTITSELPQVEAVGHLSQTRIVAGGSKHDQLPIYDLRAPSHTSKLGNLVCPAASHPCFRSIVTSDRFMFVASLRKTLGADWGIGKAVGVMDMETLQSVGEPGPATVTTKRIGGPDKLQWIGSRNLLLVVKRHNPWVNGGSEGTSYARLWDPRSPAMVWDWREFDEPHGSLVPADRWFALCDAVVSEDLSLLLKVSPTAPDVASSRLSAFDLRCLSSSLSPSTSTPSLTLTSHGSAAVAPAGATPAGSSLHPGGAAALGPPSQACTPSASVSPRAVGHEIWSTLQWQTSGGLRVGTTSRDFRSENSVLRLVAVPGSCQIISNRQPTLEVWSPVAQSVQSVEEAEGSFIPYMFRRSFGDSREEYHRRRSSSPSGSSWVYDMAVAGQHRLFIAREDSRQGFVDHGTVEVWETRNYTLSRAQQSV